jgi:hypothetical protein
MFSKRNIVIMFLVSGALITAVVFFCQYNTNKAYKENLPLVSLGDNLKNLTTQAHLWFEELLAGDEGIDFEKDIIPIFSKAEESLNNSLNEVSSNKSLSDIHPLLEKSSKDLATLIAISKERMDENRASSEQTIDSLVTESAARAGGDMDVKFDAAYESLQNSLDMLVNAVNLKTEERTAFYQGLSQFCVFLLAAFILGGCFFLYKVLTRNEIASKQSAVLFEEEQKRTSLLSDFLENISKGNFEKDIVDDKNNELTSKLNKIKDQLKEDASREKQRTWLTTGLAQIGEILRAGNTNASELYDNIIRYVVKYTNSNQGGLFIVNEEIESDKHLLLSSCYAFERKKYIQKKVQIGEGLVGQCFVEGERIYMIDVPEDYVTITSGLGGANPSSILLMPLKVNEKIFGVLELASFKNYLQHEIELVEKFAESIASTISTVRVNESTKVLLEKTQQQAEQMRAQEEEMRQNMEEMMATQEEMSRKQREYEGVMLKAQESEAQAKRLLQESEARNTEMQKQEVEFRSMMTSMQEMYQKEIEDLTAALNNK